MGKSDSHVGLLGRNKITGTPQPAPTRPSWGVPPLGPEKGSLRWNSEPLSFQRQALFYWFFHSDISCVGFNTTAGFLDSATRRAEGAEGPGGT